MKNIKQTRVVKLYFLLFLAISLLVLFNPLSGKAQNNSTDCKYQYRYVYKFNNLKGEYEWVWDYVPVCYPAPSRPKSATSNDRAQNKVERPNVSNDVYGPWGNYENLRSAIVNFFCDKFDGAASDVMHQSQIQNAKKEISTDSFSFNPDSFSEVSVLIANKLNGFFNEEMFKPEDFRPQVIRGNPKESITGDPEMDNVLRADNNWRISRYIREIYVPVVQRKLSR